VLSSMMLSTDGQGCVLVLTLLTGSGELRKITGYFLDLILRFQDDAALMKRPVPLQALF